MNMLHDFSANQHPYWYLGHEKNSIGSHEMDRLVDIVSFMRNLRAHRQHHATEKSSIQSIVWESTKMFFPIKLN